MFSKLQKKIALAAALAGSTVMAQAAPLTLPVELTDSLASVAVVGAGVFAIAVGVKLYKWVKGAL